LDVNPFLGGKLILLMLDGPQVTRAGSENGRATSSGPSASDFAFGSDCHGGAPTGQTVWNGHSFTWKGSYTYSYGAVCNGSITGKIDASNTYFTGTFEDTVVSGGSTMYQSVTVLQLPRITIITNPPSWPQCFSAKGPQLKNYVTGLEGSQRIPNGWSDVTSVTYDSNSSVFVCFSPN